jgi:hypothetical protein
VEEGYHCKEDNEDHGSCCGGVVCIGYPARFRGDHFDVLMVVVVWMYVCKCSISESMDQSVLDELN